MASRIQGITVEIGGDTTKLQNALKGVNGQIKSTQSQLKDVNKLLKLDPGNTLNTACHAFHLLLKMGTKKGASLLRNKRKTPAISDRCPM